MPDNVARQIRINAEDCLTFTAKVLTAAGCSEEDASTWSELLVETSLLGFDSHGIRMLDRYVRFIEGGGMRVRNRPRVASDSGTAVVIDAEGSIGHLAALQAAGLAVEHAHRLGTGCVAVRNGNHVGACAPYVRRMAEGNCIGICTAVSRPGMAPWGGKQPLLAMAPLAIAAPIANRPCFLLDMATSVTSQGKVTAAADLGREIPQGWALDADGNPTTDPKQATAGTLLPIGEHKGFGLAMALEIIGALLGGGNFSTSVRSWIQQTAEPMEASFLAIAIDISHFQKPEHFKRRLSDWVDSLTSSPLREGYARITYPGELAGERFSTRSVEGIPVDESTRDSFHALASRFGLDTPAWSQSEA